MGKLLTAGIGLFATFALLGPAMAADKPAPKRERAAAPERARAPAQQQQQASNWSGGQAGSSNGASSVNNSFVEPGSYNFTGCTSAFSCVETPFSFNNHKTSYISGVFLGYRVQMGSMVVGVEGDVNWKKAESSHVQTSRTPWGVYETFTGSQKQGKDGSLRLRVGTLITPWTLLYVTGGLAVGGVSGSFSYAGCAFVTCSGGINVTGSSTWSQTRVGGTVGAGVESEWWQGIKARIEYRYTDLGKYSQDVPLSHTGVCPATICGTNAHIDLRATNHRVMAGFGWDLWR